MRMIIAGLSAVLLAGCGAYVDIDNAAGPGSGPAAGNVAAPGTPAPGAPTRPGGRRNSREAMLEDCAADLGRNLPRGTDIAALCSCAVDRVMARVPQMEAVRQCAREQNVTLPGQ